MGSAAPGKDLKQTRFAQQNPRPRQDSEDHGKYGFESGASGTELYGDSSAQICGEKNRAEDGCARDRVDDGGYQEKDRDAAGQRKRKTETSERIGDGRGDGPDQFADRVEEHEEHNETGENAAGPKSAFRYVVRPRL